MSKKLNNPINGSTLNSAPAERCFASFNLGWELDQALEKLNYKVPTLVQSASIPSALTGVDIVGQARTGTGKTAAFVIPIIKDIADRRPKFPKSLIIAPTRELASQIKIEAQNLGQFKKIRIVDIVGGRPIEGQAQKLRKGAHIVVGTPGRILDLYKRGWLILDHVNKVVIDEADEMFSMGFYKDVEEIISNTPNDRQTFLFSATMSDNVKNIAFKHMKNPKIIRVKETEAQLCNIKEHFHLVSSSKRMKLLMESLDAVAGKSLVFCRTRREVDYVADFLSRSKYRVEAIHGDYRQSKRDKALKNFKDGKVNVLIATDVAARGLHVNDIKTVINYRLPDDITTYIHRIGRTGRIGSEGVAVTLYTVAQKYFLKEFQAKVSAKRLELASY